MRAGLAPIPRPFVLDDTGRRERTVGGIGNAGDQPRCTDLRYGAVIIRSELFQQLHEMVVRGSSHPEELES